jgi:hypothetical protein
MSELGRSPRRMAAAGITAVTLVLFGIVLGNVHARLIRVERLVHSSSEQATELTQLSSRYASLAKDVQDLKTVPRADSVASIATLKADWEPRISALEDGAPALAIAQDVAQLTERIETLESRLSRALRKPTSAAAPSAASSTAISPLPAKLDPPFVPLGIELRGGEPVLSILPANASSIAKARVLRPGDREGDWILERLERDAAQFRVDGQLQRLSVPQ